MMRRNDRGSSPIPFIIFLLLWLGAVYALFIYQDEYEQQRALVAKKQIAKLGLGETVPGIQRRIAELTERTQQLKRTLGFSKDGKADPALQPTDTVIRSAREKLEKYHTDVVDNKTAVEIDGGSRKVPLKVNGLWLSVPLAGDKVDESMLLQKKFRLNLQEVLNKLTWVHDQMVRHRDRIEQEITAKKRMLESETSSVGERTRLLDEQIAQYREKITSEEQTRDKELEALTSRIKEYEDERRKLEDDSATIENDFKQVRNKGKQESSAWRNKIQEAYRQRANLREQLSSMRVGRRDNSQLSREDLRTRVIETDDPDGEVAYSTTESVFINLGASNNIIPGLKFFVYAPGVSGAWNYRGKIQVVRVNEDDVSECRVIDLKDRFSPISRGDKIFNKVFRTPTEVFTRGPVRLTFMGKFRASEREMRYLVTQLKRIGVDVQESMTHWTELLVVDREFETEDDYKRGTGDLNIEVIQFDQLAEFIKTN